MAQEAATVASHQAFVKAGQRFHLSLTDTIKAFVEQFNVKPDEAEKEVKKYWKE